MSTLSCRMQEVRAWNVEGVCAWAARLPLPEPRVEALRRAYVDGAALLELTSDEVRDELKFPLGHRNTLMRALATIRGGAVAVPAAATAAVTTASAGDGEGDEACAVPTTEPAAGEEAEGEEEREGEEEEEEERAPSDAVLKVRRDLRLGEGVGSCQQQTAFQSSLGARCDG